MEVACITNHVVDPIQSLRLLKTCLKGDARKWLKSYEEGLQGAQPPIVLTLLVALKQALAAEYVTEEDPKKVWQHVQETVQKEGEPVTEYIERFSSLWEDLCQAFWSHKYHPR